VGGGVRRSVGDVSLIEQLKRLKANEHGLVEFKTPPSMMQQELQATTSDLIRIISDCLVFNTHRLVPPPPPPLLEEHSGHPAHTHTHTHDGADCALVARARAETRPVGLRDEGGRGKDARGSPPSQLHGGVPQHRLVQPERHWRHCHRRSAAILPIP